MGKIDNVIFLDLDGVLINTFPAWKVGEFDEDGYSKFSQECTDNLKKLLELNPSIRIVISSTRRIGKSIDRLEEIFSFRGIKNKIIDKVPDPDEFEPIRKNEISKYIKDNDLHNFIIIDDDKSLLNISSEYSDKLVLTEYRTGFNHQCLKKAYSIINKWNI